MAGDGILSNMFHVERFLCFKLRGGTLFLLYLTFIYSFLGVLFSFLLFFPYSIVIFFVSVANFLVSGSALLYFPGMNKRYKSNSVNAKCIKYFSILEGVMVLLGFLPIILYVCYVEHRNHYIDTFLTFALFTSIWTVVFAHSTAISYSFYLSVLQPENEPRDDFVTKSDINKAPEKNINFNNSSGRKNDTKIDIPSQPMDSSANDNGNLYVEIR